MTPVTEEWEVSATRAGIWEYAASVRERYRVANKSQKGAILGSSV